MEKRQMSRLAMLYTVQRACSTARATWAAHPAFSAGVDELDVLLRTIEDASEVQFTNSTGHARAKEAAAQAMLGHASLVARGTKAYAVVKGDAVLLAQMRITRQLHARTSAVVRARRCQAVLEAATPHLAALADYGVDQARLDALRDAIIAYEAVVSSPRLATITRKAATARIRAALKQSTHLLRYRLDGLMDQFAATAPDFHRDYFNARIVVDAAVRPAAAAAPQVIPLVPPAQQQAA